MWIKLYIMWINHLTPALKCPKLTFLFAIASGADHKLAGNAKINLLTCHVKRLLGKQTKNYNNYRIYLSSNYVAAWCSTSFEMILGNGKLYLFYIYTFICAAVFWSFQRQIDWNNLKICGKSTRMKLKKTWLLFKFFLLAGGTRSNAPVWDGFFDPRHHRD